MGVGEGVIYRSHTLMLSQHAIERARFIVYYIAQIHNITQHTIVRIGRSTIKVETLQHTALQYIQSA